MKIHPYYYSWQKRAFDVVGAVVLLILSLPAWVIIVPLIFLLSGPPVIFSQKRYGKDRKVFTLYKFRTMYVGAEKKRKELLKFNEAPAPMFKMKNDPRFVGIGKWLSEYGLDELPQFINILKGEMSFVGPRPLPITEAKGLPLDWDFRYLVSPGIFSLWAISPKRYQSLKAWWKLEQEQFKSGSVREDIILILKILKGLFLKAYTSFLSNLGLQDILLKEKN